MTVLNAYLSYGNENFTEYDESIICKICNSKVPPTTQSLLEKKYAHLKPQIIFIKNKIKYVISQTWEIIYENSDSIEMEYNLTAVINEINEGRDKTLEYVESTDITNLVENRNVESNEDSSAKIEIKGNRNVLTVGSGNQITSINQKFVGTDKESVGREIALLREKIMTMELSSKIKIRMEGCTKNLDEEILDSTPDNEQIVKELKEIKFELIKNGHEYNEGKDGERH